MIVSEKSMRAAYRFLRDVAFDGVPVPPIKRVSFYPQPHSKDSIAFHLLDGEGNHHIYIDPACVRTATKLQQTMGHEMCHAALDEHAPCDTSDHGVLFKNLAASVEQKMRWPKGSV
jgi:hypothetical protein